MGHGTAGVIAALFWCFLLLSCNSGGDTTSSPSSPCESVAPGRISADEAVDAARGEADYIIQDGEVRRSSVEFTSFGQALR